MLLASLFLWGLLVCLRYGRIGYMPLDQSIVFDGGWRLLSGQVPFRDFNAPNCLLPMYIQAVFFKIFGVNWLAYCLHSAIFNGLFCLVSFGILRLAGGGRGLSAFYAALSALVFYPPMGVPFMDQHSFFFSFLALFLVLKASQADTMALQTRYWILVPPVVVLAFLSKQIPAVFGAALTGLLLLITTSRRHRSRMILTFFASLSITLFLFVGIAALGPADLGQMKLSLLERPSQVGWERIESSLRRYPPWRLLLGLLHPLPPLALKLRLFHLAGIGAVALLPPLLFLRRLRKTGLVNYIVLSLGLAAISNLFILLTLNQAENGMPFIFVSLGAVHITTLGVIRSFVGPEKTARYAAFILSGLFVVPSLLDAHQFHDQVNRRRSILEMYLDPQPLHWEKMPPGLGFMDFHLTPEYRSIYGRLALIDAVAYLREERANFFLIGDTSILYGLTRRPSLNPCLWFHPGYSMPEAGSTGFQAYERKVIENIKRFKADYLVEEGNGTWFGISLASFPGLREAVVENASQNRMFAQIRISRINRQRLP